MSDPTTHDEIIRIITELRDTHGLRWQQMSDATGISGQILSNAYRGLKFQASTPRLNALKLYLEKIETAQVLPKEATVSEEKVRAMEERIRALEEKLERIEGNKKKNGVS